MPVTTNTEWVQYGSFGLIVFLVTVGLPGGLWWLRSIINEREKTNQEVHERMHKENRDTIDHLLVEFREDRENSRKLVIDIVTRFSAELERCRQERKETTDKDREIRHEHGNTLQKLIIVLENMKNKTG